MRSLTFRRPDDWHVHFRDGVMMQTVVPYTAQAFGRAIIMPNLTPPVTTAAMAEAYRGRIMACVPQGLSFTPLMTCYLTDHTDPADLVAGHKAGVFTAAKLYPAHATTNSAHGVTSVDHIMPVLEAMAEHAIPLLTHGEVTRADVDIFDREARFAEEVLAPLLARLPTLRVVMEHITTQEGAALVRDNAARMGATITPQHLLYNRNALFQGGLRPHMYCLPVLKRERHRAAQGRDGRGKLFLPRDGHGTAHAPSQGGRLRLRGRLFGTGGHCRLSAGLCRGKCAGHFRGLCLSQRPGLLPPAAQ